MNLSISTYSCVPLRGWPPGYKLHVGYIFLRVMYTARLETLTWQLQTKPWKITTNTCQFIFFFFHLSKQLCVQVNVLYDISAIIKMSGHNRCCCITLYMKKNCPWNRLISKSPLITDVRVIDASQVEIINFCNIDTLSHVYFNVFTIWFNKNQPVPPLRPLVDASQTSGVPQSSIPRPIIFIIRHLIYQNTIHMSLFRQLRAKTPPATLDISTTFAIRALHLF